MIKKENLEKSSNEKPQKTYLTNKEIIEEVKKSFEIGKPTDRLAEIFMILSNNIVKKFKYKNLDDRDDVIQEGIYRALKVWDKIDINKPDLNAFAFYTQVIKNAQAFAFNSLHDLIKMPVGDKAKKVPFSLFNNDI